MAQKLAPLLRRLKTKFLDNSSSSSSIIPPPLRSSSSSSSKGAAGAGAADLNDGEVKGMFERWMMEHNRSYGSVAEKEKRFEIFKETVARTRGIDGVGGGLNQFSDWTLDEFAAMADGIVSD